MRAIFEESKAAWKNWKRKRILNKVDEMK